MQYYNKVTKDIKKGKNISQFFITALYWGTALGKYGGWSRYML